jgi:MoxR-like ATPase
MKLTVNYPTAEEELSILRRIGIQQEVELKPVLFRPDIRKLKDIVSRVSVDERIEEYIVALVTASRETSRGGHSFSRYIEFGGSPRATIYLYRCAKVKALFEGRDYVVPEDVKSISRPVLRHRIVLSYEAEAEELTTDDVVNYLLSAVPVP